MIRRSWLLLLAVFLFVLSCATRIPGEQVAQVYFNLGNAYRSLGRDKDAVNAYAEAWKLDPSLFQAGFNLARLELEAGQIAEGRSRLLQLLSEDRENTLLLEALAWSYSLDGNASKVQEVYRDILTVNPQHIRVRYNLAVAYRQSEEWEAARDAFWELYTMEYKETLPLSREELRLEVAQMAIRLEDRQSAMGHLEFLFRSSPSLLGIERLGLLYQEEKLYGKALELYQKAKEVKSSGGKSVDVKALRGRLQFEEAFILLTVVEDEEPGMEALTAAVDAGIDDPELFERLLGSGGFLFTEQVEELIASKGIGAEETGEEEAEAPDGGEGEEAPVEESPPERIDFLPNSP